MVVSPISGMVKKEGANFWLPPLSLVIIALIVGMISLSPWRFDPISITGQALLLIIVLRAFCYWPPLVRWIAAMPIPHRVVFGLVIAGMIMGHYTINSRQYFPFVAWEIFPFVNERDPVTCPEFIATTASGKKVRLLVEQLFPSIVQINPLDNAALFPPETLEHLARTMAKAYNQHHPDDPVRQVDLVNFAIHLHPPATESHPNPSCELLKRYDISSDHSN